MVRVAVLSAGEGLCLQAILDALYYQELPGVKLAAVVCTRKDCNAMTRALNAGVPSYVVDPDLFPNATTHSKAVANKMKDLDIDLVVAADYDCPLGVIPLQFKKRVIAGCPTLYPAFEGYEEDPFRFILERGVRIAGATVYFCSPEGEVGPIILQKAVDVQPEDTPETLKRRVLEGCEAKLLPEAVRLFCGKKLSIHGNRVIIDRSGE